jgi:BMFP domain-containing protein YqiC
MKESGYIWESEHRIVCNICDAEVSLADVQTRSHRCDWRGRLEQMEARVDKLEALEARIAKLEDWMTIISLRL